jgi:hypothetical protein
MGMAKMRGKLADAIRANHVIDVENQLKRYTEQDNPDYIEKIRHKQLKDAERLAVSAQRKNQRIITAIRKVRASRANRSK